MIVYHRYSAVAYKKNADAIIIPNYWFYLATDILPYNIEIHRYYEQIVSLNLFSSARLNELKTSGLTDIEWTKLESSFESKQDAERIRRFLTDYKWWHGGKELGRVQKDYFVSAVLSLSGLVNDSATYLSVLCEVVRENPQLSEILVNFCNKRKNNDKIGIVVRFSPYLTALRTKPFMLLAGISGTGKSRIVREMAFKTCPKYLQDKDGTTPGNYCMIEVKPNWHDSTELIGYYSNLSQCYQFKKFVKFLIKAQMNPEVPFFVCLDEMNLAPVEQYFAEILSILETRNHPKSDGQTDMSTIKTGIIVDGMFFDKITWKDEQGATHEKLIPSDADWYKAFFSVEEGSDEATQVMKYRSSYTLRNEGLKLPDNVFIIGTVNMDDTTHQFSRKVIDRAMTIEMNGGNLANMFGGSKDLEYLPEEEQQKWQQSFRQYYVTADEVLEEHAEVAEELKKELPARLEAVNKALKGTPFEVSYRVLNELTIMVGVMLDDKKEGDSLNSIIDRAINNILLMKILPRIEGDAEMFALSKKYKDENEVTYNDRLEWLQALAPDIQPSDEEGKEHQSTAKEKIQEMRDRLENQEFTRFWP